METKSISDELALKLPILEAEVKALRQLLAEVKSDLDELRRDRDDERNHRLAERAGPIPVGDGGQRAWFTGRASARG